MMTAGRSTVNPVRTALSLVALAGCTVLGACDKKAEPAPSSAARETAPVTTPAADNTARNKGDGGTATKSPMDQSEAAADIKITAAIRSAIMDDKTMSVNAQNCKIITEKNGVVTLRGAVNSQAERAAIEAKAHAVAGVSSVDNQLEVKPS